MGWFFQLKKALGIGIGYERARERKPLLLPAHLQQVPGVILDLHEEGALVMTIAPICEKQRPIQLQVGHEDLSLKVPARLCHQDPLKGRYGLEFLEKSHELALLLERYGRRPPKPAAWTRPFGPRKQKRHSLHLPVMLGEEEMGVSWDVSASGMALLAVRDFHREEMVECGLLTPQGRIPVKGRICHKGAVGPDGRRLYGLQVQTTSLESIHRLQSLVS